MESSYLDGAAITRLSQKLEEPDWTCQSRLKALERHSNLAWPERSEESWKKTASNLFDPFSGYSLIDKSSLFASISLGEAQANKLMNPLGDESVILIGDGSWIKEDAPSGLAFDRISRENSQHKQRLDEILDTQSLGGPEQKLCTLNEAFHNDDVLISIPEGYSSAHPIRFVRLLSYCNKLAHFPLTVILAGRGSKVVVVDESFSLGSDKESHQGIVNSRIELLLEPGARVEYIRLQRWGSGIREFVFERAALHEDSHLSLTNIILGSQVSKSHIVADLIGKGSSSNLYGFVFGQGQQHIDQYTIQEHKAPNTVSDLLFKAALKDKSQMAYSGLIKISKGASQAEAYQSNNNLLLDEGAKADTIPMLEILSNDVKCKHAATVAPVDYDQIFYLMSRGMNRLLAERMLVMGFVEPIISQIPFGPFQEVIRSEVETGLTSKEGHD